MPIWHTKRVHTEPVAGSAVRLVGATGVVGAAAGAHVAAGADLPAPALLAVLVLSLAGLAGLATHLPAAAQSIRARLAVAVALQPGLHVLFDWAQGHSSASLTMPAAHLVAAGLGAWWLARGAKRLVVAVGALGRRILSPQPVVAANRPERVTSPAAAPTPMAAVLLRSTPRRGPPVLARV